MNHDLGTTHPPSHTFIAFRIHLQNGGGGPLSARSSIAGHVLSLTSLEMAVPLFNSQMSLERSLCLKLVTRKVHQMEKGMLGKDETSQDVVQKIS